MKKQAGFTLAELLIALALLGIIAAFTIPKVLQATGNQESTAKVREAVSTLEQSWYNLKMQNQTPVGTTQLLYDALVNSMNTVSQASTSVGAANAPLNAVDATHPCGAGAGVTPGVDLGWLQFANGVVITGLANTNASDFSNATATNVNNYVICIDYNGASNPNLVGTDIFFGTFNQFGDFDAGAGAYTASDNGKNFFWGTAAEDVYDVGGGALGVAAAGRAGSRLAS